MPSIGHFILQQEKHLAGAAPSHGGTLSTGHALRHVRPLPEELLLGREEELGSAPRFKLAGLVIGNGLTDPAAQVGGLKEGWGGVGGSGGLDSSTSNFYLDFRV